MKKLYVNSNLLSFAGIPAGISKLAELEIFSASDNKLEMLPEGLCRCGNLKKLILNKNKLKTLPMAIYTLQLEELDISENPEFQMPIKPIKVKKNIGAGISFYNVDFSLERQLILAGAQSLHKSPSVSNSSLKDPNLKKKRLKVLKPTTINEDEKVLKGMRDVASRSKQPDKPRISSKLYEEPLIKGKRWEDQLVMAKLEYDKIFQEDVGHIPGIICYEIEKFLPNPVDRALNGEFYEGDCYIVLETFIDASNSLNWQIYFWIGSQSSV